MIYYDSEAYKMKVLNSKNQAKSVIIWMAAYFEPAEWTELVLGLTALRRQIATCSFCEQLLGAQYLTSNLSKQKP